MDSFVHLHSHSEYSLLDGAARLTDEKGKPGELLKRISEMKMPALAVTDHGNLYGAIEFYQAAQRRQRQTHHRLRNVSGARSPAMTALPTKGQEDAYYHFTLLARDNEGYQNLIQLCSIGFLEGYYYKPRVDKEVLAKYSKGLIALSGCLKGELARGGSARQRERRAQGRSRIIKASSARKTITWSSWTTASPDQKRQNEKLLELSKKTGVPLVATNDCHYLKKDDARGA